LHSKIRKKRITVYRHQPQWRGHLDEVLSGLTVKPSIFGGLLIMKVKGWSHSLQKGEIARLR